MQSAPALQLDQQAYHNLSQGSYGPTSASLLSLEAFKSFSQSQELKSQRACTGHSQIVQDDTDHQVGAQASQLTQPHFG